MILRANIKFPSIVRMKLDGNAVEWPLDSKYEVTFESIKSLFNNSGLSAKNAELKVGGRLKGLSMVEDIKKAIDSLKEE